LGVTTYEDIMEEIIGYKNRKEITYTATQDVYIRVIANNPECYLTSRTLNLEVSDQCTEIEYTGDKSVFIIAIDQSCSKFNIEWDLERSLKAERNQNLYIR